MVSIRPHFPTVKHTPAKESKVHNGGGLKPVLHERIFSREAAFSLCPWAFGWNQVELIRLRQKKKVASRENIPSGKPASPPSWSSHLLVASCVGKPGQDMGFKVHNGEGPYSHPDLVSPAFLGALTLRDRAFCLPNFANKGFAWFIKCNFIEWLFECVLEVIYKIRVRSLSVYKDTRAKHSCLYTLIKNGYWFCK